MGCKKQRQLIRMISLVLAFALVLPINVCAAVTEDVMPCASYYLDSYNCYVCPMGSGRIETWFTVAGTGYMDDIGALTIRLYESTNNVDFYWVDTFRHTDYPDMLAHNDYFHAYGVSYQGVAGCYYKAYVTIWAGKDGGGDTRYMWTLAKLAT